MLQLARWPSLISTRPCGRPPPSGWGVSAFSLLLPGRALQCPLRVQSLRAPVKSSVRYLTGMRDKDQSTRTARSHDTPASGWSNVNDRDKARTQGRPKLGTSMMEEVYGRRRLYSQLNSTEWTYITEPGSSYATSYFRSMFLPISYPQSVHSSYLAFHGWQAVETFIGAIVGVLCSQAMLESLGVSADVVNTAGAVAIQVRVSSDF